MNSPIDKPVGTSHLLKELAQRIDQLLLASGRDLPHVHNDRLLLFGRHHNTSSLIGWRDGASVKSTTAFLVVL